MRFDGVGSFLSGAADVDPVALPQSILLGHLISPKARSVTSPAKLHLILLGAAAETLTLDLYFLVESKDPSASPDSYKEVGTRWVRFATGEVVTNGALTQVTTDLPAGGIVYARRTGDTIAGAQTRKLLLAWS